MVTVECHASEFAEDLINAALAQDVLAKLVECTSLEEIKDCLARLDDQLTFVGTKVAALDKAAKAKIRKARKAAAAMTTAQRAYLAKHVAWSDAIVERRDAVKQAHIAHAIQAHLEDKVMACKQACVDQFPIGLQVCSWLVWPHDMLRGGDRMHVKIGQEQYLLNSVQMCGYVCSGYILLLVCMPVGRHCMHIWCVALQDGSFTSNKRARNDERDVTPHGKCPQTSEKVVSPV